MANLASVYFLSVFYGSSFYAGHREREIRAWVALMDLTGAQEE